MTGSGVAPVENAAVVAPYANTNVILNASQPAYGVFNLHLTGTAGKNFVLQSSANLLDWVPLVTNLNSAATFSYEDTNVLAYGCRFFRIVLVK